MAKRVRVIGTAKATPAGHSNDNESAVVQLSMDRPYQMLQTGHVMVSGTLASPFHLMPGAIPNIHFAHLRSTEGARFTVLMTSGAGANQQVTLSDSLTLHCPEAADAYTDIALVGSGMLEFVLAGDNTGATPTPPPPLLAPAVTLPVVGPAETASVDTVEKVVWQGLVDFDDLPWGSQLRFRVLAVANVSAGTGRVRVLIDGGSLDLAGTEIATVNVTALSPAFANGLGPITATPSGVRLLKVTVVPPVGQSTIVTSATLTIRSA